MVGAFALAFFMMLGTSVFSQSKEDRPSPPKTEMGEVNGNKVVVDYSSPGVKGRKIWGGLVPYDEVWRTGANEATTILFEEDVKVNGKELEKGKYSLFTIPGENKWTFIFNSVWDQWGAFNYDESKDALRVEAEPSKTGEMKERMEFEIDSKTGKVNLLWENLKVGFTVE